MEKIYQSLHEVEFGSSDASHSRAIRRKLKEHLLRPLGRNIYTSKLQDPEDEIVRRNWHLIVNYLFPGALLSHKSALQGGPG